MLTSLNSSLLGEVKIETFHEATRSHTAAVYHPGKHSLKWEPSQLKPGQTLREPKALFKKLDEKIAEEEKAKLGKPS